MHPSQLILTISPLQFLTEQGENQSIYSIRVSGIQNVNESIALHANATICLDSCEFIESKIYNPLPSGVFAFYTPVVNHWLAFRLEIENEEFEIHPAGTSIAKLVSERKAPAVVHQQLQNLNQLHKFENTTHLSKRSKQNTFHPSLQFQDHDPISYRSTLFKVNRLEKRGFVSGLHIAFDAAVVTLGRVGHSFVDIIKNILLIFDWNKYLNVMEFFKYYIDNSFYTIWESMPIAQQKMAHWVNDLKLDKIDTAHAEMHAKMAQNITEDGKEVNDPRTDFIKDHTLRGVDPEQLKFSLKDVLEPSVAMGKSALQNLGQLVNSPPTHANNKHGLFANLKVQALHAFGNVTTSTFPVTKPFHKSMLAILNARPPFVFSLVANIIERFVFKNRFELTFMNTFLMIGAIQSYLVYFTLYREVPITDSDLISIRKSPHLMNMLHVWLKDPISGPPTPYKEYRLRCIVDWFPKQLVLSLLEVIALELIKGPTSGLKVIPQTLYVLQTFVIVAAVFPVDFIESQRWSDIQRTLGEIYPPYYTMWYLWNLTCMWHVLRPIMAALDLGLAGKFGAAGITVAKIIPNSLVFGGSFMNIFHKVKALLMGIPQIFCITAMISDLKKKVHFNNPIQVTHFALNSFSWWMDTMTMVNTLFLSVDGWIKNSPFLQRFVQMAIVDTMDLYYVYAMLGGYFARTLFMETAGLPGVFLYYKSYFITASDPLVEIKQVEAKIPSNLHGFMSIRDPSFEIKLKGKEVRESRQ